MFASLTREILFLPLEHKIHIFSPPCNILYILLGSSLPVSYICVFSALSNSRQIEYRKNLGQTSGGYPIYQQELGRSAKSKIPDRLGFSRRMKTRLYGKEMYKKSVLHVQSCFFLLRPIVVFSQFSLRSPLEVMLHGTIRNDDF